MEGKSTGCLSRTIDRMAYHYQPDGSTQWAQPHFAPPLGFLCNSLFACAFALLLSSPTRLASTPEGCVGLLLHAFLLRCSGIATRIRAGMADEHSTHAHDHLTQGQAFRLSDPMILRRTRSTSETTTQAFAWTYNSRTRLKADTTKFP